jgi:AcrR family transcriptional regulator
MAKTASVFDADALRTRTSATQLSGARESAEMLPGPRTFMTPVILCSITMTDVIVKGSTGFRDGWVFMTSSKVGKTRALRPRERMVRSAAELIRRKGVSGTGMREIVIEADAPRGSLQHYFPGGKEELVSDALLWMGGVAVRRIHRYLNEIEPRTPSALLVSIVDGWRSDLTSEGFSAGCPLVAAAADTAANSEHVRNVLQRAFDGWLKSLSEALIELGVPPERSEPLAIVIVSALEGAIILARIRRDLGPFDALVSELSPLLDAVATPA